LQEELVGEVANTLKTQVYRLEIERVLRKPDDLTAWECVTRAIAKYRQVSIASLTEARDEAARAVAIAPDYGLAHAMLAQATSGLSWMRATRDAGEQQSVLKHVERALALDPDNGAVLASVGVALCYIGQHEAGLRYAGRAIQRSPQFGLAHLASGVACEGLGRIEEALAHYEDAQRLESHSDLEHVAWFRIGRAHLRGLDWHAADAAFAWSIALDDYSPHTQCEGALVASHLGRADNARAMMARSRRLGPATTLADWERRLNLWNAGSPALDDLLTHLRALWAETEGVT
jgi:tetratricopeptide (TPR) repeat protein